MPMPSKGKRHSVTARLPIAEAEKLEAIVKATNDTRGDYIVRLVIAHLATVDLEAVEAKQEALPMAS
ncbi:hypothetical protein ACIQTW_21340 [Paenarthrobacter sp. NPDC090517]|uniref:hypothetical protein n=1 Tax=Paenarthrobacter sp. NPDC090517 TaxID=3364381 RepID=UPI0037F47C57